MGGPVVEVAGIVKAKAPHRIAARLTLSRRERGPIGGYCLVVIKVLSGYFQSAGHSSFPFKGKVGIGMGFGRNLICS